jgi:nucleoside-diphosphate-sugar epimerase
MKCLVTGGAGFIGSNLVDTLIERGDEVRVIDNLVNGKKENVNPKAELVVEDIRNLEKILPYFKDIDVVFHLAALPRVQYSVQYPRETNETNITGTLNVLLAAKESGVKRVVYSSSSSVYGNNPDLPLKEWMKPCPMSPYGLHKLVGEEYARIFSIFHNLETVSLRYFNVYGPRMNEEGAYTTAIAIFLRQKKNGEPLTITGDGTQTRDFTHVRDVCRANILAAESKNVGKGEVINIGAGRNFSINQIAELIGGHKINIPPRIEPHDTLADNSLAKKLLNWEPQIKMEEGIEELKRIYGV